MLLRTTVCLILLPVIISACGNEPSPEDAAGVGKPVATIADEPAGNPAAELAAEQIAED